MNETELMDIYLAWQAHKKPEHFEKLYKAFEPTIQHMISKWNANLDPRTMKSLAKVQFLKALETYDPDKGTALGTHVYNYLQKLSRYSMSYGETVRMPENLRLKVGSLLDAINKLREKLGRDPTIDELADELAWPKREIERIFKYMYEEKAEGSLEMPAAADIYTPKEAAIESIYRKLSAEEKLVFEHLTGYGGKPILKAKDIAKKLGVSPAQVSNIRKRIIEKFEKELEGLEL
ncbi:MAG: hypothetical protein DSY42_06175 [Aquifex sp.]|nr:MAG: hypothetical protein DSY42_06175 [Aquifex sp.]